MPWTKRSIDKANAILRELDAIYPSDGVHPAFQLMWSDDLVSIVPQYTSEGQPVMQYRCFCGVDRMVHEPWCDGLTVAKVALSRVSSFGLEGEFSSYPKSTWVLCRWNAPPTKAEWIAMFDTDEDYPENGRYLPVHAGQQCVIVPPRAAAADYPEAARLMVTMMRLHQQKRKELIAADIAKGQQLRIPIEDDRGNIVRDADKGSPYWKVFERAKSAMQRYDPDATVGYSKSIDKESANA